MMFDYRGFWGCPIPGKPVKEKVCQIVWFGGEGEGGWLVSLGPSGSGVENKIEDPTLVRRSLPIKGTGLVIVTKKEWVKKIP